MKPVFHALMFALALIVACIVFEAFVSMLYADPTTPAWVKTLIFFNYV